MIFGLRFIEFDYRGPHVRLTMPGLKWTKLMREDASQRYRKISKATKRFKMDTNCAHTILVFYFNSI